MIGLCVSITGEVIRWRSVGQIGPRSRTRSGEVGPLITTGPFARSRNPIYLGNLLIGTGMAFATGVPALPLVFVALFFVQYTPIVAWEEWRLAAEHGEAYDAYRERVPRWFPRPGRTGPSSSLPWPGVMRGERSTLLVMTGVYASIVAVAILRNNM